MVNRCFVPYIIGTCVLVILAVSFVGARAYKNQVKTAAEAFAITKRILESETPHEHTHNHTNHNYTNAPGEYDQALIEKTILESETPHLITLSHAPGEYDQNRWYTQVTQGNQLEFQLEFENGLIPGNSHRLSKIILKCSKFGSSKSITPLLPM